MPQSFHQCLKFTLALWFGDRFTIAKRGSNIRIKMKDGSGIPITLQLIFSPDRPVRPTLKSIQKSTSDWEELLKGMQEEL